MSDNIVFIGMDPGKEGFITLWDGLEFRFYEMPKRKVETGEFTKTGKPKTKTEFNPHELLYLMLKIRAEFKGSSFIVGIEDVHALADTSAASTFNFGKTVGIQTMALHILNEKIIEVSPKRWQSVMWKGFQIDKKPSQSGKTMVNDTKSTSIKVARHLFPNIDLRRNSRCTVEDDNKVDSLLICEYLKRMYKS